MPKILEINSLSKIYGKGCSYCNKIIYEKIEESICPECNSVLALKDISFSIKKGDRFGIVGESGSGKSTLLKILYLLETPTTGDVIIYDNSAPRHMSNISINQVNYFQNNIMSFIRQNPYQGLNFNFTASGNVAERVIAKGNQNFNSVREISNSFLSKTGILKNRFYDLPSQFSGGQQQRIQIAKALASNPQIILLDEPTTGLDLTIQAVILDLLKALYEEYGFTMVVVSHDLGIIKHLTDICIVMKNGSIVEFGLTDQILQDPQHPYTQSLISSML